MWWHDNCGSISTCEWTSNDAGSHGDVSMPVYRVKTNKTSDERRVEIVNSLQLLVNVTSELLHLEPNTQQVWRCHEASVTLLRHASYAMGSVRRVPIGYLWKNSQYSELWTASWGSELLTYPYSIDHHSSYSRNYCNNRTKQIMIKQQTTLRRLASHIIFWGRKFLGGK